jgi:hypothetical protein
MPRRTVAPLLLALGVYIVLSWSPASAAAAGAYSHTWASQDYAIPFYYTDNFPGPRFRNRVWDGARQWNNVGRGPRFVQHLSNRAPYRRMGIGSCGIRRNNRSDSVISWQSMDGRGNNVAITQTCLYSSGPKAGHIGVFTLTFDAMERWYTGSKTPPAGSADAWSAASHELGHALGANHFARTAPYCANNSDLQTMCPKFFFGSKWMRSLGGRDIRAFSNAYPPR